MIQVEKFDRPVGGFHFGAQPQVSKNLDQSKFRTPPPLKEAWGRTKSEAIAKARSAMQAWAEKEGVRVTYIA